MAQWDVKVPLINNNEDTVRLVRWEVDVGQRLEAGQTLATVETSKATVEVECERAGFLRWRAQFDNDMAPVGEVLAVLTETQDEAWARAETKAEDAATLEGGATVKAVALARELGIDLDSLRTAHPGERITERHVRQYHAAHVKVAPPTASPTGGGRRLIIAGDGAHARYMMDTIHRAGVGVVVGCVSNRLARGSMVGDLPVLGTDDDLPRLYQEGIRLAAVGIGSDRSGRRSNEPRRRLFERLKAIGFELPTIVDPDASLSASASLGEGTVVGARAVVSAHARVGANCIVNVGCIVCHDAVVEDHVHLTPGAILAGTTFVGMGSTIGMAATILDGTRVGRNCLVPNNARVIKDLADESVAPHE